MSTERIKFLSLPADAQRSMDSAQRPATQHTVLNHLAVAAIPTRVPHDDWIRANRRPQSAVRVATGSRFPSATAPYRVPMRELLPPASTNAVTSSTPSSYLSEEFGRGLGVCRLECGGMGNAAVNFDRDDSSRVVQLHRSGSIQYRVAAQSGQRDEHAILHASRRGVFLDVGQ